MSNPSENTLKQQAEKSLYEIQQVINSLKIGLNGSDINCKVSTIAIELINYFINNELDDRIDKVIKIICSSEFETNEREGHE